MWSLDLPFGLGKTLHITAAYEMCGRILKKKLEILKEREVVDICSGAGGPIPKMATAVFNNSLQPSPFHASFTLTDLFPHLACAALLPVGGPVKYVTSPVDACQLPKEHSLKFRTSFGSFHHLPVPVARAIFQDVVNSGCGFAIFEATGRDFFSIMGTALMLPLICAYLTIFEIRPIKISRFFFYFILPIMPLLLVIDGTLSNLRTYEYQDYMQVLATVEGALEHYDWEYTKEPVIDLRNTWLANYSIGSWIVDAVGRLFLLRVLTGLPKSRNNTSHSETLLEIPLDR